MAERGEQTPKFHLTGVMQIALLYANSAKHSGAGRYRGSSRGRSVSTTPGGVQSRVWPCAAGNVTLSAVPHRWYGPKLVNIVAGAGG